MIGSKLSHYEIIAKLGAGSMGEVYRAEDTKLRREVAIKVLPTELAGNYSERLERFQREARAIAALNHPNIVTIYSVEEAEIRVEEGTEDITTGLAKFAYITVADGAVSEGSTADVQEISNRLGARFLLRGRIRRAGPMIRCSAHLVDAETGVHIWSENYDRKLDESSIFDIQDGLTDTIVGTVADASAALLRSAMAPIRKRPVGELTVADWLVRAITHMQQIKPDEHALLRDDKSSRSGIDLINLPDIVPRRFAIQPKGGSNEEEVCFQCDRCFSDDRRSRLR